MQIKSEIVLMTLAAVLIVGFPGWTAAAKNNSAYAAASKKEPEPLPSKTKGPLHSRSNCEATDSALESFLCHAAQALLPEFPGGNAALYIINQFLGKSQNQHTPVENDAWNEFHDENTAYLHDSLSESEIREIGNTLDGYNNVYQHVKSSTTGTEKTTAWHTLFLSMLLHAGKFKGHSKRAKSLLLKYFDRFTILFSAVTQELKSSNAAHPPEGGAITVDNTFTSQQCNFYQYQCQALFVARQYACRDIVMKVFDTTPLGDDIDLGYRIPPDSCSDILDNDKRSSVSTQGSLKKRTKGCGALEPPARTYVIKIYNTRTDRVLDSSRSVEACPPEKSKVLYDLCREASSKRSPFVISCIENVKENFEEGLTDHLDAMKDFGGSNCRVPSVCKLL